MPQVADQAPHDAIVVTGIGMVTPLGEDRESSWKRLVAGDRACRRLSHDELIERGWPTGSPEEWTGAPAHFPPQPRSADRVVGMALQATGEALTHAAWSPSASATTAERTGCVIGTSKGDFFATSQQFQAMSAPDSATAQDADWLTCWPHTAATSIAAAYDVRGPLLCPVAACATGLVSLIRGADLIRSGACDVVIAGSSDAALHPALQACYRRMGVLARSDHRSNAGAAPSTGTAADSLPAKGPQSSSWSASHTPRREGPVSSPAGWEPAWRPTRQGSHTSIRGRPV